MAFETNSMLELLHGGDTYEMRNDETIMFSGQQLPVLTAEQAYSEFGVNAPILAAIGASSKKTFCLLDTRKTPNGIVWPDNPRRSFVAGYLLVDEQFSPNEHGIGYKAVRQNGVAVQVGRKHYPDRFAYPLGVSRNHFSILFNSVGLYIRNESSTNSTRLRLGPNASQLDHRITKEIIREPTGLDFGLAEKASRGEDRSLIVREAALFGVFDGVGGHDQGDVAAQTAATSMRESFMHQAVRSSSLDDLTSNMKRHLQEASNAVTRATPIGATTGVVAQVVKTNGQLNAIWAAAGDSRLYKISEGRLDQINVDEGEGSSLSNCLGVGHSVQQAGHFALKSGDQLLLVSDGITGDYGADILSDKEIVEACKADTAAKAAQNLVDISRKRDDKTAIVVNI